MNDAVEKTVEHELFVKMVILCTFVDYTLDHR